MRRSDAATPITRARPRSYEGGPPRTQPLGPAGVDVPPPNTISLRDLITQRQQSGQRFHLPEVVAIVVPICTDLAQRHARGETVYVHASSIGAGLDGTPRLVAQLARRKPKHPSDLVAIAPELATGPPPPRS